DTKPFAVMFRDISAVREYCITSEREEEAILSWRRPVIILKQRKKIPESVNSGLSTIGAMLPYMPLHHILFRNIGTPAVVLTSGNLSDEPVIIDDKEAEEILMTVADSIVLYNRKISNRADDSVIRIIDGRENIIRRSRGYVPLPVDVRHLVEGIIATGAEQKNSFCLGKDRQAVMSQYIGDLKDLPVYEFFQESVEKFSKLFRFTPKLIVCDLHPDYLSTRYAEKVEKAKGIPIIRVQHHHAHIASVLAENRLDEKVIGISLDGTGFGTDGNIWGSEFLIAGLSGFRRYTHFDYVPLPGGDKAVEEPWRIAFSYLFSYFGNDLDYSSLPFFKSVGNNKLSLVREMIINKINTPLSCGAGRIFDAVSAILGLCPAATFDSEAPMRLESVIDRKTDSYYPYELKETVQFSETFREILKDIETEDVPLISAKFHNTIARIIIEVSVKIRNETGINKVALSGGVFQNKYLLERSLRHLRQERFEVFTNSLVPANDGGISLGQLVIASKKLELCV
ncbi:MAG: carbamoyltransferase HypF, partial [Odoribacter sp.]|nr:carbamoyltransferase HypF [Odoribacter sp.]